MDAKPYTSEELQAVAELADCDEGAQVADWEDKWQMRPNEVHDLHRWLATLATVERTNWLLRSDLRKVREQRDELISGDDPCA